MNSSNWKQIKKIMWSKFTLEPSKYHKVRKLSINWESDFKSNAPCLWYSLPLVCIVSKYIFNLKALRWFYFVLFQTWNHSFQAMHFHPVPFSPYICLSCCFQCLNYLILSFHVVLFHFCHNLYNSFLRLVMLLSTLSFALNPI